MENKEETHPPPTLNTNLAGGDGGIASWSLLVEKKIRTSGNLKIILQSFKLPNNRVMPVIAGVGACLENCPNRSNWYHLADYKICEFVKKTNTSSVHQTFKT